MNPFPTRKRLSGWLCCLTLVACGSTAVENENGNGSGASQAVTVQPEPGVAQNITLRVYSDGWGTLLETKTVTTEGSVTIDVQETDPYSDPPAYYVYATADGFYTELYTCTKGGSIAVDLDAVPQVSGAITGALFARQSFFAHSYVANQTIQVTGPDNYNATLSTDSQGRYGLQQLPLGTYTFSFEYVQFAGDAGETITIQVNNDSEGVDYQDLSFAEPAQAS